MPSRSPTIRNLRSDVPHNMSTCPDCQAKKLNHMVTPDVKETQFINEPIQPENVRTLSPEICYSQNPRGSDVGEYPGHMDGLFASSFDPIGNPFLMDSRNDDSQSSQVEAGNGQSQYWGHVEPWPLEPHEIALPPISSPDRLSLSPQLPPLPEEEEEEESSFENPGTSGDFPPIRISDLGLRLSSSGQLILNSSRNRFDIEVDKILVDVGTQTSDRISAAPMDLPTNPSLVIEDWDQFVFVEHDLGERTQPSTVENSLISFHDEFAVPDGSDDERLQKRLKNWPRYIQNLLEA